MQEEWWSKHAVNKMLRGFRVSFFLILAVRAMEYYMRVQRKKQIESLSKQQFERTFSLYYLSYVFQFLHDSEKIFDQITKKGFINTSV